MDTVIEANNVSMSFRIDINRASGLKEWLVNLLSGKRDVREFRALSNVSFTVERGEVIGIIGRNGSGKSTLLKVIAGIYKPTGGMVKISGNVVPMLELGSGFDFELTGYENIFLNGAILGYSEQYLNSKLKDIIEFSELGDFIHMPIKTYSSGMMMRLAFSIATVVEPEILIIDEILAVGDEFFQKKSFARMQELMSGGTTVLFVSHNIEQIQAMCNRVIWLENGVVRAIGPTDLISSEYKKHI